MCGSATLAIVLSTPCMIVASMIEAVIRARVAPALRSPPLTRLFPHRRPYQQRSTPRAWWVQLLIELPRTLPAETGTSFGVVAVLICYTQPMRVAAR